MDVNTTEEYIPGGISVLSQEPQKKHDSLFFLLSIVVFLSVVSITVLALVVFKNIIIPQKLKENPLQSGNSDKTSIKNPLHDGEIVLVDKGKLYVFDTSLMEKRLLSLRTEHEVQDIMASKSAVIGGLNFSRDGRYLLFNCNDKFCIYDFITGIYKILNIAPNPATSVAWMSNDGKYTVVDTGTGPGARGKTIVEIASGKILYQTTAYSTLWSPDNKIVFDEGEIAWWNLGLGPDPENKSVYIATSATSFKSPQLILKGTNMFSYESLVWLDANNLIYSQSEFKLPIPSLPPRNESVTINDEYQKKWLDIFGNPSVTYWKVNLTTGEKESYQMKEKPTDNEEQIYSPSGAFKIVREGKIPNSEIYIEKTDGSEKKKIGYGQEAIWRPKMKNN